MVFEELPDGVDEDIVIHAILEYLLNLGLTLGLQYRSFLLEEQTDAVKRYYLQRFAADDPVQQQKELLEVDEPNETVEHPRKHYSQRLDLQFLEFGHYLLLVVPQQLLEQYAQTYIKQ